MTQEERGTQLAAHYALCDRELHESDRARWLASLFAPQPARGHLHAIYAFAAEVAAVRARVSQPLLGEMRLRWWLDALEGSDEAGAGARAHPVADALLDTIARCGLPRDEFIDYLEARVFDLYDDPMESLDAAIDYCRRVGGAPLRWAAQCLGWRPAAGAAGIGARAALDDAGIALALAEILRDLPRARAAGQMFIPLDLLLRHGSGAEEARAGAATPGLRAALADLRAEAAARYGAARAAAGGAALGSASAAFLPAAIAPLYLKAMTRHDYAPFETRVEPSQWRLQWRLWRASRGGGL